MDAQPRRHESQDQKAGATAETLTARLRQNIAERRVLRRLLRIAKDAEAAGLTIDLAKSSEGREMDDTRSFLTPAQVAEQLDRRWQGARLDSLG
jgi:hypothetical protein